MDVVLVDRRRSFRAQVEAGLLSGDRLVEINEHWLASGRWQPNAAATRAVLLAVHHADAGLLRALHRLWAAEHAPACYLLSAAGSAGEHVLQALLGAALPPPVSLVSVGPRASSAPWVPTVPMVPTLPATPDGSLAPAASSTPVRPAAALRWRAVAGLGLSQLLALERLAASNAHYQNE